MRYPVTRLEPSGRTDALPVVPPALVKTCRGQVAGPLIVTIHNATGDAPLTLHDGGNVDYGVAETAARKRPWAGPAGCSPARVVRMYIARVTGRFRPPCPGKTRLVRILFQVSASPPRPLAPRTRPFTPASPSGAGPPAAPRA